jgi:Integrase core domain
MYKPDDFSQYYAELLEGIYDCVDRIASMPFFRCGRPAAGMRSWWRNLRGDDSQLDDKHLREMAGTFSRRLHAFCAKQGIPIIEAGSGERKHELASRKVLAWRLSNTMDTEFCIEALEEALAEYDKPEIFNSDQGSQFTSPRFTQVLKRRM